LLKTFGNRERISGQEELMKSNREAARRKGLRMAAQLAAIGGLVAASAAAGMNQAQAAPGVSAPEAVSSDAKANAAEDLGEEMRLRQLPTMGCFPAWGPPAPPAMRPELFDAMSEAV
jgi:hypothetical protein